MFWRSLAVSSSRVSARSYRCLTTDDSAPLLPAIFNLRTMPSVTGWLSFYHGRSPPPGFNFELALQELRGLSVRCRQQHKYRRDRKQPRQMRAVSREVHNFGRNCNGIVNASMAPCESPPKILALAGLWAVFVYSGYLQAPLLKDCNSAHRPHIFPCDVSATVTHLRHHRRTQRPTGRLP